MGEVTIQYISDLHIDSNRCWPDIIPVSKNIAICGDVGSPFDPLVKEFYAEMVAKFERVFVVAGNHEYYWNVIADVDDEMGRIPGIIFLNNTSYDLTDEIRILGTTLWSDIDRNMHRTALPNDYRRIYTNKGILLTFDDTIDMHNDAVAWLDREIYTASAEGGPNKQVLILTHHAPLNIMNGKFIGTPRESAFATDLMHLFRNPVVGFINGHTHQNMTCWHNGISVTCNAVGYKSEALDYNPGAIFKFAWQMCDQNRLKKRRIV